MGIKVLVKTTDNLQVLMINSPKEMMLFACMSAGLHTVNIRRLYSFLLNSNIFWNFLLFLYSPQFPRK